jgi:hypothetical protein
MFLGMQDSEAKGLFGLLTLWFFIGCAGGEGILNMACICCFPSDQCYVVMDFALVQVWT